MPRPVIALLRTRPRSRWLFNDGFGYGSGRVVGPALITNPESCIYLLALQLSATLLIDVTSSVFAAFALALAPVAPPVLPEVPVADPEVLLPGALVSGLLVAEAEAFAPAVPVTSTC